MPNAIPLWNTTPPGTPDPARASEPAAKEVPHLIPFILPGKPRPLVIVCPGGGYGTRAGHEGDPIARWLNALGISAAVLHYRHSPFRHPVPLHDAQRAIRLLRLRSAELGVDGSRIGILGFSAGGHLACSAANFGDDGISGATDPVDRTSSRLQALVSSYAVISFGEHRHHGSMVNLLGVEDPEPALRQRLSLETSVTARNPPSFIWSSADDSVVDVRNSLHYSEALLRHKVPFALHVYPHAPHGIGLGFDFPGSARLWTHDCAEWFFEIGFR